MLTAGSGLAIYRYTDFRLALPRRQAQKRACERLPAPSGRFRVST